jgi:hypothetical protein
MAFQSLARLEYHQKGVKAGDHVFKRPPGESVVGLYGRELFPEIVVPFVVVTLWSCVSISR